MFGLWFLMLGLAQGKPFDPFDFSSLGTLNLSSGDFTIDTDALTIFENTAPGVPLFAGVIDNQRGLADSFGPGGDATTVGPLGIPHAAVFTFDAIDLASTANITVTGHRALVLLSHGNATINTTIDVSGGAAAGAGGGFAAGTGRAGGFDGGGFGAKGVGPGGGSAPAGDINGLNRAAGGSFGSLGENGSNYFVGGPTSPGPTYGDLSSLLQGGSGGGGVLGTLFPPFNVGGGAGGGALEIGAAQALTIGPSGQLLASGGENVWHNISVLTRVSGNGSGGGIRLHGATFESTGQIIAEGGYNDSYGAGGGGRVLVYGLITTLAVGEDLPDIAPHGISVADGDPFGILNHGVVVVSPGLALVPVGQSLQLGNPNVLQEASPAQPRIELVLRDVRADAGGELTIPAGGFINAYRIELDGISTRITGSDPLANAAQGELRGTGRVEVEFINDAGGQVNAINDALTFTQAATNHASAEINAINSTLDFQAGLTNDGQLNLINTTIQGDVHSPAGSTITVVGDGVFEGLVSGSGNFPGAGGVTFNGGYSPGDNPAQVAMSGDLTLGNTNTLYIELGGTTPGDDFDQLVVSGDVQLGGNLDVQLLSPFALAPGQQFTIIDQGGNLTGEFDGLGEGALVDSFGGVALYISYQGGVSLFTAPGLSGDYNLDGHVDAADYVVWRKNGGTQEGYNTWQAHFGQSVGNGSVSNATVPEPATSLLLILGTALGFWRGRLVASRVSTFR